MRGPVRRTISAIRDQRRAISAIRDERLALHPHFILVDILFTGRAEGREGTVYSCVGGTDG